jgi:hypothetical protein
VVTPASPSCGDDEKPEQKSAKETTAKKPSGPHQEAIAFFCDSWQAKYGAKYLFNDGKDAKHVADILKHLEGNLDRFREVVTKYLASADPFHVEACHGLGLLRSQLNRFIGAPAKPPPITPSESILRAKSGEHDAPMVLPTRKELPR